MINNNKVYKKVIFSPQNCFLPMTDDSPLIVFIIVYMQMNHGAALC